MKRPPIVLLRKEGRGNFANGHLDGLRDVDRRKIEADVLRASEALLDALRIRWREDHNTRDTPRRLAKMYVREVFRGRYESQPAVTYFPNVKALDELYTLGPITIRSTCSHHFVPIIGKCWIGVVPSKRLIGISKFTRLVDWIMARPQIQEEAAVQIADLLEQLIEPRGIAVVLKASHLCMTWRGVRDYGTEMTSSVMRGLFREAQTTRSEFLSLIGEGGK